MNLRNRKLVRTIQILFGIYLIFIGLVASYFIDAPIPEYNEAAMAFISALFATNYILHLNSIIFVLAGLMFIFDRGSAFGAVLLAPVTVNIFLFHVFLDFLGFWFALVLIVLNIYLLAVHWPRYKPMFKRKF